MVRDVASVARELSRLEFAPREDRGALAEDLAEPLTGEWGWFKC